tara:strand:- start:26 stop:361 length:336 start_codon:yes stop_codon:yes gene_type:complete
MIKDLAIRAIHTNVASVYYDNEDNACAYDEDGVEVTLDANAIATKTAELQTEKTWSDLREKRNSLIAETDYLALSDVTLSSEMATYRQALRDLPANTTDPANPVWPTKPEA